MLFSQLFSKKTKQRLLLQKGTPKSRNRSYTKIYNYIKSHRFWITLYNLFTYKSIYIYVSYNILIIYFNYKYIIRQSQSRQIAFPIASKSVRVNFLFFLITMAFFQYVRLTAIADDLFVCWLRIVLRCLSVT